MALSPVLIVGVGNEWRGDDGAGIAVARALGPVVPRHARVEQCDGEGTRLVSLWDGSDRAIVIDAVRSGRPPGEVLRFDLAGDQPEDMARLSGDWRGSTHAFGLASAVSLARALGRLPRTLTVYGIEGEAFEHGAGLSPAVRGAVDRVVADILASL